ncbi:MAG: hypothetical protein DCC59_00740 [Chloroflexi bacterium]|nr:DMT family transporter [Chloroflexi bacterium CFX1]MCK6568442.1 DMT family transporter [Anaerolineales bacterium]MCQ3953481.1 hypothetical protein [Chloroflexota bacterium]MDL1920630.1 DMT family transporter [Chloroflexi bacterium CFX5]NUQ58683.1 DMT family transporter [Anaerolineales bacterium]
MPRRRILPYIALLVGIASLSLSAMFVRWAEAPGTITGFYRLLIATSLLTPLFIRQSIRLGRIEKKLLLFPLLGGMFTAFDFALWNTSVQYTSAANATLLGNTAPLWVALIAFFFLREKIKGVFWLGLALALAGAALVMGSDFLVHPSLGFGDLLACAAAVFYAFYQLVTQRGRARIDLFRYAWLVCVSATIFIFAVNLYLGNSFTGYSTRAWTVFFATAVVSQVIGYLSVAYALGYLPASVVAPTLVGQPILTAILAIPLLGEIPAPIQWTGGAIALAGIYIVHQSHRQTREETPNA